MCKIKIIFFIAFFCQINYAQNYIVYSNATQTKTANSNEEVIVSVTATGYGSDLFGLVAIAPNYCAWDNGLIGIIYSNGKTHLRPGEVETINLKFKKTVTTDHQFIYTFTRPSPIGNSWDSCNSPKIKITVNYKKNVSPPCSMSKPANFVASNIQETSFTLNWGQVTNNLGYTVNYRINNITTTLHIPQNVTTTTLTNLLGGKSYSIEVYAKPQPNCSITAAYIVVTTLCPTILSAPTSITATPSGNGYIINCAPANYYTMEYVDLVTNQTGTTWVITGENFNDGNNFFYYVSPPKSFKFRLKQFSGNCNGFSDWVTVIPQLCPSNNFPTNLVLTSQYGSNTKPSQSAGIVTWDAVPNAAGYKCEYVIFSPFTGQSFIGYTDNGIYSFIPGNYFSGTWYIKFRVKTRCSNNTWSDYSPWSANFIWN